MSNNVKNDEEIVKIIRDLFIVRDDCFPMQKEDVNEYTVIKGHFSDEIIRSHLRGSLTAGSFQIDPKTNKVKWICFDFDGELSVEFEKAKQLYNRLKDKGYNPLLEFSGRRGYHIWLFVEPVDAALARKFAHQAAEGIEVSEIFPKQDRIKENQFGGQVKIPLGVHRVSHKRSCLFNDKLIILSDSKSVNIIVNRNDRKDIIMH